MRDMEMFIYKLAVERLQSLTSLLPQHSLFLSFQGGCHHGSVHPRGPWSPSLLLQEEQNRFSDELLPKDLPWWAGRWSGRETRRPEVQRGEDKRTDVFWRVSTKNGRDLLYICSLKDFCWTWTKSSCLYSVSPSFILFFVLLSFFLKTKTLKSYRLHQVNKTTFVL